MLMTILLRLLHKKRPAAVPVARDDGLEIEADAPDERPLGCGWFDSSHELQCGLVVTVHTSPDAVAADLPLSDWLALHLGGWPGSARTEPCLA